MTKDQTLETETEEEPIVGFVREGEDEGEMEKDATVEVVKGEVVEEATDELTALRQQLEAVQARADEYLDDLRRERAAFQNYKKRQENERAELWQMAQAELLLQIIPTLDDMERALEAFPGDPDEGDASNQADQSWVEGILLIQRKLQTTLEGAGVVPIEAKPGQPFDPFIHEAVSHEENDDYEEGEIIAVVQKGHKLGERVLRPAMVRVAR
jgi:molecular chaperone GrpE